MSEITTGLVIRQPWLDMILNGTKTWEIRGNNTRKRGRIALIESGSGLIIGETTLVSSLPVSRSEALANEARHQIRDWQRTVRYARPHAWVLRDTVRLDPPRPYRHPRGAVVWVCLQSA